MHQEKKEVKEFKKYVKTEVVQYGDLKTQVIAFGRVQTAESLELIAEVSGKMRRAGLSLKEGQRFRKGTVLCTIDDTEAKLNLERQI
jgi:multidrug efflux pump subunit AcrA (membrane-fusion protein)